MSRRLRAAVVVAAVLFGAAATTDRTSSYEFMGAVWPGAAMPVAYCVNATNTPIGSTGEPVLSPEAFAEMVQAAFQTWENITEGGIRFWYLGLCENDPWDIADYTNTVGWDYLWSSVAGLAHPLMDEDISVRGDFGELFEVDIIIDSRLAQSFDDLGYYLTYVLPHILLHEAGHFIGLDHSQEPCSVMAPAGLRPGPCWDDIEAARALYPR